MLISLSRLPEVFLLAVQLAIVVVELLELVVRQRLDAGAQRRKVLGLGGREEVLRRNSTSAVTRKASAIAHRMDDASAATSVTMRKLTFLPLWVTRHAPKRGTHARTHARATTRFPLIKSMKRVAYDSAANVHRRRMRK